MLRVISAILGFIVFFLVVVFLFENIGAFKTEVPIYYNIIFYKIEPLQVPVWVLLLIMLAAGILMTFFIELVGWFKTRSRLVSQKRSIKSLEKELQESRSARDFGSHSSTGTPSSDE